MARTVMTTGVPDPAKWNVVVQRAANQRLVIAFDTQQEALNDVAAHAGVGTIVAPGAGYNPASSFTPAAAPPAPAVAQPAAPVAARPAAPVVAPPTGTPQRGNISVTASNVGGNPVVSVATKHQALNDQVTYTLYVMLNSTPVELKPLGTFSAVNPASYTSQQTFNLSYPELTTLLHSKNVPALAALTIGPGAQLAIGARWATGHTWGINGRAGGAFNAP